jgi:hypothetical protein
MIGAFSFDRRLVLIEYTEYGYNRLSFDRVRLESVQPFGFYYIPGVLCQCPRSQLVLSAVHDDNIECFLKS